MKLSQPIVIDQSRRKAVQASIVDLVGILFFGMLLMLFVMAGEYSSDYARYFAPLRIPLGILYVLFTPGYLLQAVLFPHRQDLDGIERIGLSLGLSIAIIPLLALVLDRLPWGLHMWAVVIGQGILVIALFIAAVVRRLLLPVERVYTPNLGFKLRTFWRDLEPMNRRLLVFLAVALIFAVATAAWIFLVPPEAEFMTEFYILGTDGLAESYPREVIAGQVVSLTAGVTNREGAASTYNIQIKMDEQVIGQAGPFTLEDEATWEQPVEFVVPIAGDDQQITFSLERMGKPSPYRYLRLWMNVKPAQSP